ncbi:MAG: BglG family transcription antiterminator [Lachnospiraceae bacterium]|nr:BglG family transcription antiterminator [Lachnospiraceae bacterium]
MPKKTKLSKRQKTIIQMLARFTSSNPVTVQAISEKLNLSSRTILRELPKIEEWMEQNDFNLVKKPRVGIYLDENQEQRNLILELLEADKSKEVNVDKEQRIALLKKEILGSEEPLKYYYFTSKFGVSEGTLSTDLDEVEAWFENYGLTLIRRKGLGVLWAGAESDFRQAVVSLILHDAVTGDPESINYQNAQLKAYEGTLLEELVKEGLPNVVTEMLKQVEQSQGIRYTDNAAFRLNIMLLVTIERIRSSHSITDFQTSGDALMKYEEYQSAAWMASVIEADLGIAVSAEEIAFITTQLLSAKVWQPKAMDKYEAENIKNRQVIIHMVLKMEELMDMNFLDDRMLIDGLCNHIGPAISRIKMHVPIENPTVDMLKEKYLDVFDAARDASEIIKAETGIEEISDEELAFLVLHFCASAEKQRTQREKISVIVACPNGIGTSHMLAAHLQKAFPEVVVKKVIAASTIDPQILIDNEIDLIVSTVKLNVNFPNVSVNPVLLQNDRMVIRNEIKNIRRKEKHTEAKTERFKKGRIRRKEIEYLVLLGEEILQVFENIKLSNVSEVEDKSSLIRLASELFARNDVYAETIERNLWERENTAGTYISTFKMLFLHCITKGVRHCRFGYVALKKPIVAAEGVIQGAIVVLVPEERYQQDVYKEVMSEVSGTLAENDKIIGYLLHGQRNEVAFELEKALGNYYQRIMKEYGEI